MDIIFKGRHTDVLERFRRHATAKLSKIARLDSKAIRVDVEVSKERNPRQSGRRERVELTISSRGPAIRAEAAAEDRFTALDMAFAKLESRLRRAGDRRKCRHGGHPAARAGDVAEPAEPAEPAELDESSGRPGVSSGGPASPQPAARPAARETARPARETARPARDTGRPAGDTGRPARETARPAGPDDDVIAIQMEGEGPLVVREKFHGAVPMSIDQALFEMEMVGHDFFLFRDSDCGEPSVVYRRRGYQYGVLRLVEQDADRREAGSFAPGQPADDSQLDGDPLQDGLAGQGDAAGRNASPQPGGRARRNGKARRNAKARRNSKAGREEGTVRRDRARRNGKAGQAAGSRSMFPAGWPDRIAAADQEAG